MKFSLVLLSLFFGFYVLANGSPCARKFDSQATKKLEQAVLLAKDVDAVHQALSQGGDASFVDNNNTLLHRVVERAVVGDKENDLKVVQVLIKNGAPLNHLNNHGYSALYLSVVHNKKDIALEILNAGAEFAWISKREDTLLHKASFNNHLKLVAELIKKLKAKGRVDLINKQDENGRTPFDLAATEEMKNLLKSASL